MVTAATVNLDNCDREQVQYAGAIQPHGAMLVLDADSFVVRHASANCRDVLGRDWDALVGQNLEVLLGSESVRALRAWLPGARPEGSLLHAMRLDAVPVADNRLHLFVNRADDSLLLEFEPACKVAEASTVGMVRDALRALQFAGSLHEMLDLAVRHLRDFSGFDRVMAYRFDAEGSGEVVAEALRPDLEPYLGLNYPASDIPLPARRLFALSPLRYLPDSHYAPVPLLPQEGSDRVDLSCSNLRSVSTMYTGYLRNMGVRATLVMPLMKQGRLWGLISCMQHDEPKFLPYEERVPLELLAQMLSQLLATREDADQLEYRARLESVQSEVRLQLARTDSLQQALTGGDANLLSVIDAGGVALLVDARLKLLGRTPTPAQIDLLLEWLGQRGDEVVTTHALGREFAPAAEWWDVASGLLAIRLSRKSRDWILWFRAERVRDVCWAGDPNKPVAVDAVDGEVRLQPRTSFAMWKETARGQSRPWLDCEVDHALQLRNAVFGKIVERAWLLAQVNAELERSNLELDAFAYAASHDMKEPLRGIHNTVEFLKREKSGRLSERGGERIDSILRLTERMAAILDALLQYSRLGKNKLELEECDLDALVRQVARVVRESRPDEDIEIRIPAPLPVITCDRLWVGVVFQNLIANGLKYNRQAHKLIEIGCDAHAKPPVFHVRDNGIGIAEQDRNAIFDLFRRLHGREQFGGGSGVGLTIAKRAIERHGGLVWLESLPEVGSVFRFTLAPAAGEEEPGHDAQ